MNYSSTKVRLTALAGVERASLDNGFIVGHWKRDLAYIKLRRATAIVEHFVNTNSEDPNAILRFTRNYGPLSKPPDPLDRTHDLAFRQSVKDWREFQAWLRGKWSQGESLGYKIGMRDGEQVHFDRSGRVCALVPDSLARFMEFEIFSTPFARRRRCENPECGVYFLAARKDSRVCNKLACTEFRQHKFKTDWWKNHGEQWRAKRKSAAK